MEKGVNKRIFQEVQAKRNLSFQFREKSGPFFYVSHLAGKMHEHRMEDVIYGDYSMEEYLPGLL